MASCDGCGRSVSLNKLKHFKVKVHSGTTKHFKRNRTPKFND